MCPFRRLDQLRLGVLVLLAPQVSVLDRHVNLKMFLQQFVFQDHRNFSSGIKVQMIHVFVTILMCSRRNLFHGHVRFTNRRMASMTDLSKAERQWMIRLPVRVVRHHQKMIHEFTDACALEILRTSILFSGSVFQAFPVSARIFALGLDVQRSHSTACSVQDKMNVITSSSKSLLWIFLRFARRFPDYLWFSSRYPQLCVEEIWLHPHL